MLAYPILEMSLDVVLRDSPPLVDVQDLLVGQLLPPRVDRAELDLVDGVDLEEEALLDVVVEAANTDVGIVLQFKQSLWVLETELISLSKVLMLKVINYLEVFDKGLPGYVVDVFLHSGLVAGQGVVVVEAVDVDVGEVQLGVGEHPEGVHVRWQFLC